MYAYEFEENSGTGTAENITVKKYSLLDIGGKNLTLQTKDIDFGAPGKIKKVYKVYVTARDAGAGTDLTMKYATDGSTSFGKNNKFGFFPSRLCKKSKSYKIETKTILPLKVKLKYQQFLLEDLLFQFSLIKFHI